MQLPAVGRDAANPLGPIARSSTGDRNSCFQTQRPGRSQPADPVALLDQGQSELVGLDGQVSELDQADVEAAIVLSPQVAEEDLAVGRGGEPAGRGTEDPADARSCRALVPVSGRRH